MLREKLRDIRIDLIATQAITAAIVGLDFSYYAHGILSSIVDNVPPVAASMGMYSLSDYPVDHMIWEYLAYCAGTGGSLLIIGSDAGVAVMGMEKVDFIWYVKKISFLAFLGYAAGAAFYVFTN